MHMHGGQTWMNAGDTMHEMQAVEGPHLLTGPHCCPPRAECGGLRDQCDARGHDGGAHAAGLRGAAVHPHAHPAGGALQQAQVGARTWGGADVHGDAKPRGAKGVTQAIRSAWVHPRAYPAAGAQQQAQVSG